MNNLMNKWQWIWMLCGCGNVNQGYARQVDGRLLREVPCDKCASCQVSRKYSR